ncbi:hypothetical protein SCLCIDRAFT_16178 [Scleroderma citrinum Foug A]|uniref:Mak10-domain-containing protein n=1 Tax=Scleroderma citrinum Foug A TaxID=1036808 RepID=A0A0C3DKC9_9AGAM|nr:hypothetical protein SCLCIDRAFT_16178 [Scleroderma citrinum Foug A]
MDHDDSIEIPGGTNYKDVTALFEQAGEDMQPGALVFDEGFKLHDAMAAFEIGEPRFDSGLALLDESRPPFKPLTPLLPEEVCWIIDRAFACEMEWHAGYTLSQTIFTCMYVHALTDFDPDLVSREELRGVDNAQPIELVTVILRASILGLLKCCDLSWREFNKGNVYDAEDWQSDKCDVYMSEAHAEGYILRMLDEACDWLRRSPKARSFWRNALFQRLNLRKVLVQLLEAQLSKEYFRFRPLIDKARGLLQQIRISRPPPPHISSAAARAFDPQFPRVLVSMIPLHIIQLPEQDKVWDKLAGLLDSLEQLSILIEIPDLSTWNVLGTLQLWQPKRNHYLPYTRSAFQSAIYDNGMILNKYTQKHVVDCFFMEGLQMSYESFVNSFRKRWRSLNSLPLAHIERSITELVIGHLKSHWYNPTRRRRYYMKSLFDWHELYALLADAQRQLAPVSSVDIVSTLRLLVLLYRYENIREVILSGFQLSLYAADERPFAYWYLSQVLEQHLACFDQVIPGLAILNLELQFRARYLTALQAISVALFCVTHKSLGAPWQRMRLNFMRRYKWAFLHEYEDIDPPPLGHPNFLKFTSNCAAIWQDNDISPAGQIELAERLLTECETAPGRMTGPWSQDRIEFIAKMVQICRNLRVLPRSMADVQTWNMRQLQWDPELHPWLPLITNATS